MAKKATYLLKSNHIRMGTQIAMVNYLSLHIVIYIATPLQQLDCQNSTSRFLLDFVNNSKATFPKLLELLVLLPRIDNIRVRQSGDNEGEVQMRTDSIFLKIPKMLKFFCFANVSA